MNTSTVPEMMRRSSRVPFSLPIHVTSLEPSIQFSEDCETLVVNAHGCAVRSPVKLAAGVPVHFHNRDGRQTTAYVVDCQPLGNDHGSWLVGARLDKPDNFWGLKPCPADWTGLAQATPVNGPQVGRSPQGADGRIRKSQSHLDPGLRVVPTKAQESMSEERVRALLGEILQPLYKELFALREKLAQPTAKRSSFEVSLSQIPPELEEQLWLRLREELGAEVRKHATQETERVLEIAKTTIGRNMSAANHEFRQHLTEELQLVQVRAQRLSDEIDDGVRQQLEAGLQAFHEQGAQAGARIEERGGEFFRSMQQKLNDENERRLREVKQVKAAIDSESSQMQARIADLGGRVQTLNDSAHHLESGMEKHLSQISNDIISEGRGKMESHVDSLLADLQTKAARELSSQLDVACGRLKLIQTGIETSVSQLLNAQASRTLKSFEHSLEELAGQTVLRWRESLARNLTHVAKILGNAMQSEPGEEGKR